MKPSAVIITRGHLLSVNAKTCHGLLRGTDRFEILAVIDDAYEGKRTPELLSDVANVPVVRSISDVFANGMKPKYIIVGVAFEGGQLPADFRGEIMTALASGVSVVNGLHTLLSRDPEMMQLARQSNAEIIDIRLPKPASELHFWSGKILEVTTPRIAVLGTDCAVGKRTTCNLLYREMLSKGHSVDMIYTGQTGWLEGRKYGFILDSTLNDFVSGELEHAVYESFTNENPDYILIEGQSSLQNPSGPCGSEMLLSLRCRHVVLQHDPVRRHYDGHENTGIEIRPVETDIQLIRGYGAEVVSVVLKPCENLDFHIDRLRGELGLPVYAPNAEGIASVVQCIAASFNGGTHEGSHHNSLNRSISRR